MNLNKFINEWVYDPLITFGLIWMFGLLPAGALTDILIKTNIITTVSTFGYLLIVSATGGALIGALFGLLTALIIDIGEDFLKTRLSKVARAILLWSSIIAGESIVILFPITVV